MREWKRNLIVTGILVVILLIPFVVAWMFRA